MTKFAILNKITVKGILESKNIHDNNVLIVNTSMYKRVDLEKLRTELEKKLNESN